MWNPGNVLLTSRNPQNYFYQSVFSYLYFKWTVLFTKIQCLFKANHVKFDFCKTVSNSSSNGWTQQNTLVINGLSYCLKKYFMKVRTQNSICQFDIVYFTSLLKWKQTLSRWHSSAFDAFYGWVNSLHQKFRTARMKILSGKKNPILANIT